MPCQLNGKENSIHFILVEINRIILPYGRNVNYYKLWLTLEPILFVDKNTVIWIKFVMVLKPVKKD